MKHSFFLFLLEILCYPRTFKIRILCQFNNPEIPILDFDLLSTSTIERKRLSFVVVVLEKIHNRVIHTTAFLEWYLAAKKKNVYIYINICILWTPVAGVSVGSNPGQSAAGCLDAIVTLLYVSLKIPNKDETVDCIL